MRKNLLILDIDGVIADCSHRLHFQQAKDYDAFYSAENMLKDEVIVRGKNLARNLAYGEYSMDRCDIFFLTGRPERTRLVTEAWMDHNDIYLRPEAMIMRRDGDYRPSDIVKSQGLLKYFWDKYTDGKKPREINKLKKKKIEEVIPEFLKDYESIYYVDDDPKNVKAVCELFPQVTGIVFGTERIVC